VPGVLRSNTSPQDNLRIQGTKLLVPNFCKTLKTHDLALFPASVLFGMLMPQ